jgi:hypothetical protein
VGVGMGVCAPGGPTDRLWAFPWTFYVLWSFNVVYDYFLTTEREVTAEMWAPVRDPGSTPAQDAAA